MEAIIFAIVFTWAVKKAAEWASQHWQGAKAANRQSTRGQPVSKRAASAARHDTAYWARQARGGFPQVRHGLYMGWHSGRIAQLEGRQARAEAKAEHAEMRARVTEAVREQRRRQEAAFERIRAASRQPEPEPEAAPDPEPAGPESVPAAPGQQPAQAQAQQAAPPPAPSQTTEGTTMSGDTNYDQQIHELEEIRRDADAEVNSVRRKRMQNRVDILASLSLDRDTLNEAAAIDDALREQEKAAQQTLDASDTAIAGLKQRHGGIKAAVDDSPVDKPADGEFYTD